MALGANEQYVDGFVRDPDKRLIVTGPDGVPIAGGGGGGGGLTNTELRAAPVPVSGPLTDAQLRATAVPVSGPLTDAQLRASGVPMRLFDSLGQPLGDPSAVTNLFQVNVKGTVEGQPWGLDYDSGAGFNIQNAWGVMIPGAGGPVAAGHSAQPFRVDPTGTTAQPVTGPLTDAQLRAAAVPVSGPLTDAQLRASAVPVSGPLTDAQLRAAAVPVSGPLTDAQLRASAVPVDLPAALKEDGRLMVREELTALAVTNTGAAGAAVTVTLPAAGAGLFHVITDIDIVLYASVARVGAAAPWVVTTTNLPGNPAFTFSTAAAVGTNERQQTSFAPNGLKASAANTATTIVAPIATGGIWRINVTYYLTA